MSEKPDRGVEERNGDEVALVLQLLLRAQFEQAALLQAVAAGEQTTTPSSNNAFAEFVLLTQHRLAQLVLPLVHGDKHLAEDVVQEVYLKSYRNLRRFDPTKLKDCNPYAWLMTIAHRTIISNRRRRRPLLWVNLTGSRAEEGNGPEPVAPDCDPGRELEAQEQAQALHRAVDELPPDLRKLVQQHYEKNLSHREIADENCLTQGQVNMSLHAARKKIRATLERLAARDAH